LVTHENRPIFIFQNGQVVHENKSIFLILIIYIYIIKKIQENIHEESLKDHPILVVEDQDNKWKSYRTKMYKNSKISNLILTYKRPYW